VLREPKDPTIGVVQLKIRCLFAAGFRGGHLVSAPSP
jgi:hypothetical protein